VEAKPLGRETHVKTSTRAKSLVASVIASLALAAPAAGAVLEPQLLAQTQGPDHSTGTTLHRDGSAATPFVAQVGDASTSTPTVDSDGFDWGDAAIGAGAGLMAAALAMGASSTISGRRARRSAPASSAVSQGV
jgi:hypothetical protein